MEYKSYKAKDITVDTYLVAKPFFVEGKFDKGYYSCGSHTHRF